MASPSFVYLEAEVWISYAVAIEAISWLDSLYFDSSSSMNSWDFRKESAQNCREIPLNVKAVVAVDTVFCEEEDPRVSSMNGQRARLINFKSSLSKLCQMLSTMRECSKFSSSRDCVESIRSEHDMLTSTLLACKVIYESESEQRRVVSETSTRGACLLLQLLLPPLLELIVGLLG